MADAITIPGTDDGQSIPAVLAATPESTKSRARPGRAAKVMTPPVPVAAVPAPIAATTPEIVAETAHEPVLVAEQPEPEPVVEPAPEPVAGIAEPLTVHNPPAAVPAEPQKEDIMATTIDNVTDTTAKAQAFFADASERSKGALAKSGKILEDATAFSKGNVEAIVESSKIAAKGLEALSQEAAEFSRKSFEEATAVLKTLASVKSPTEFMKLQSDFMRQSFDALVAESSRSTETMLKLAGEVAQPISNRLAVAAEKLKPTM